MATTIRKAMITEVSVHKGPEMDVEAKNAFKEIVKTGLALKSSMKSLHPILVRLKLINGDETHDEISENKELKLLMLANLAAQLPDRVATTGYGQGKISMFDLYINKTDDQLIAFFKGKKIVLNESEFAKIKNDAVNLYQWLRRLRDETINSWDLAGKPSKRANTEATKKAAVEKAVEALVNKRTAEQAASDNDSDGDEQDDELSDVTPTIGENKTAKKKRREETVQGRFIKTLNDYFPANIGHGVFLKVQSDKLYCAPHNMLTNMYGCINGDLQIVNEKNSN